MNFFLAIFAILFVACQPSQSTKVEKRADGTTAFTGQAMTMEYKVLIGQNIDKIESEKIASVIRATFQDTDTIFNKWNPHSELSKLNQQKAGVVTPLSPNLLRLFKETDSIVKLSQGRFDPSIEPLQNLWKEKLLQGKTPSDAEIKEISPAIGWHKISFENGLFIKAHDQTKLDFGGIAKGLCIDMIVERLNAIGISNLFVEWGGEIRASGRHPEGRPWTIYISHLGDSNPEQAIATLALKDQAIATSGDYLQNWTVKLTDDEKKDTTVTYFHIFDPKTLMPLEATHTSVASVSVIAPNCALADGLATIPMMFSSLDKATEWAENIKEQLPDTAFWIISRSSQANNLPR